MNNIENALKAQGEGFDKIIAQIQAQYRGTNIEKLLQGIIDIQKKYILGAMQSLVLHNFSLNTAKGDGLDLWGFLLGFHRYVLIDEV